MSERILKKIQSPTDIKNLKEDELLILCKELRTFIINAVATKEGHLGASLGVVELTVALHYVFNTPNDLLVWDVGHQAYGHKILTGRKEIFHTNRQLNGISGFPKRSESLYDAFGTGHSSTSISAVLGMAVAAALKGELNKQHIAVIGDASIVSGMAFEGLNHAGVTNVNMLIILNDNDIGIDPSVGALKEYLARLRKNKISGETIFDALKIKYYGAIDGNNLPLLIKTLNELKAVKGVKILHITTLKGKGLKQAEENQVQYHAPGKFNAITGERIKVKEKKEPPKYQDVFGYTLVELANNNPNIIGITPAMPTGSSLKYMMEVFPDRTFDVGIAEQHAVTFSAGLATRGLVPYCVIYSTFLQRAYDQIIHDVALQNLPVVFCVDRAGLVGEDGATHHGVFDLAYLQTIPNLIVAAPKDEIELRNLLYTAQLNLKQPIAIRYPRGKGVSLNWQVPFKEVKIGKGFCLKNGSKIAVLSIGTMANNVSKAINNNTAAAHYHFPFIKPLDTILLNKIFTQFNTIITVEEGTVVGGFGSVVASLAASKNYNTTVHILGVPDKFIAQGTVEELHDQVGISAEKIAATIQALS